MGLMIVEQHIVKKYICK
uniref:Uncharacterized protein n=1 Tax=Rhizophora mucronata TaxID=61149 RepID=A0A2P2PAN1_RHIMU